MLEIFGKQNRDKEEEEKGEEWGGERRAGDRRGLGHRQPCMLTVAGSAL